MPSPTKRTATKDRLRQQSKPSLPLRHYAGDGLRPRADLTPKEARVVASECGFNLMSSPVPGTFGRVLDMNYTERIPTRGA